MPQLIFAPGQPINIRRRIGGTIVTFQLRTMLALFLPALKFNFCVSFPGLGREIFPSAHNGNNLPSHIRTNCIIFHPELCDFPATTGTSLNSQRNNTLQQPIIKRFTNKQSGSEKPCKMSLNAKFFVAAITTFILTKPRVW